MATNQTAHLGLCQWEADDPVLRADFNADNQKLDAALGGMALVRLMSVTTETAVNAIELDLTGIDISQFCELQLRVRLRHSYDPNAGQYFRMLLNNVTSSAAYWSGAVTGQYPITQDENAVDLGGVTIKAANDSHLFLRLHPTPLGVGIMVEGFNDKTMIHRQGGTNVSAGVTGANLARITFYDMTLGAADHLFAAGGAISVYGVMK